MPNVNGKAFWANLQQSSFLIFERVCFPPESLERLNEGEVKEEGVLAYCDCSLVKVGFYKTMDKARDKSSKGEGHGQLREALCKNLCFRLGRSALYATLVRRGQGPFVASSRTERGESIETELSECFE